MVIDPDSPAGRGSAAAVLPGARPVNGNAGLDRQRIVGAAIELIDRDGLRAFTMRQLGRYLGVEAMALYHYLPGRDALLDAIVEVVVDELYGDPEVHLSETDWQRYLQRLAHGVRRIALAHPEVFPLVATRPPAAPWIRPPLRSLRWIESFLDTLHRCGFSDEAAVVAYRAFSSFLLGHLLLEVAAQGADIGPVDSPDPGPVRPEKLVAYPVVQRLSHILAEDHALVEFEEALEALLDRLEITGKR